MKHQIKRSNPIAVIYKLGWAWRSCTSTFFYFLHLEDYEIRKSKGSKYLRSQVGLKLQRRPLSMGLWGTPPQWKRKWPLQSEQDTGREGWLCKRRTKRCHSDLCRDSTHLTPPGVCNSNCIPDVQMIQTACLGSRMPRTKQTLLFSKEGSGERLWNIFSEVHFFPRPSLCIIPAFLTCLNIASSK